MALSSDSENPNIAAFLKRNHVGVLATANEKTALPHAAAIYYTTTSKLNFFFVTKRETTKSKNLESNPQTALVIYEASTQTTAQIDGVATQVNDPVRLKTALEIMAKFSSDTAGTSKYTHCKTQCRRLCII